MCKQYERKLEKSYAISAYIAEFWNTVSNLPFIIIGLLRLYEGTELSQLYFLMILAGICSGIHHATTPRWTIVVDWTPIFMSFLYIFYQGLYTYLSYTAIFQVILALFILVTDHIITYIPVPWGHVMWHIVASLAVDCSYQSICKNM